MDTYDVQLEIYQEKSDGPLFWFHNEYQAAAHVMKDNQQPGSRNTMARSDIQDQAHHQTSQNVP